MCDFLIQNIEEISVSIDAATKETYQKIRIGGDFDNLINGLKRLQKRKEKLNSPTPKLITKFVVMKLNYKEIQEFVKLINSLGINTISLGHVICSTDEQRADLAIYNDKKFMDEYLLYLKNIPDYNFPETVVCKKPSPDYRNCPFSAYKNLYITRDGSVRLCCHTGGASKTKYFDDEEPYEIPDISFGNIYEQDLKTIWENPEYQAYRYGIVKGKPYGFCQRCLVARGMFI